jgi:hypothetical protein
MHWLLLAVRSIGGADAAALSHAHAIRPTWQQRDSYEQPSLKSCHQAASSAGGVPIVKFGSVPATGVFVAGSTWIKGKIPSNPTGACLSDVTVQYNLTVLTLPASFCYMF